MGDNKITKEVDVTAFEKSFDDSIDTLAELLNGGTKPEEEILKAKKEDKAVDLASEMPEDDEDDDDEEDDKKKEAKKSLPDALAEIPEVAEAMDVEPFLRELAKSIDERFAAIEKGVATLKKSIANVESLSKAQGSLLVNSAALMKATSETVEKIGDTPVPSTTLLRKSGDRFPESKEGKRLGRDEILTKALELKNAGKLSLTDVTKIEGRLNKNLPIEDKHLALITGAIN